MIICSIENLDPMGVHTGDSITVAPAQTLTDKEYQRLRDASVAIIREMGVECGGSNVQMAVNPADGEVQIIEMNPRVSRSSAVSFAFGSFPPTFFLCFVAPLFFPPPFSPVCFLGVQRAAKLERGGPCLLLSQLSKMPWSSS